MNRSAAIANRDIVQRDCQLRGLENLLEPSSLSSQIGELLHSTEPLGFQLTYLRYKPRRRCIALLNVRTESRTETVIATAMTADSWKNWFRKHESTSRMSGRSAVPDRHICLERFPFDQQLRHIARLDDPQEFARLLKRILPDQSSVPKRRDSPLQMKRLAYKPARRLVVSVGSGLEPLWTIKFHAKSGFRSAVDRSRTAAALQLPDFTGAVPCERYQTIATPWVNGTNLCDLDWSKSSLSAPELLSEVGLRLAELHLWPIASGNSLRVCGRLEIVAELQELQEDLALLCPDLEVRVRNVVRAISDRLPGDDGLTLIHGDFYAKQVIVSDRKIQLIDFDELCVGHPWQDVGNFVAKLHWNQCRGLWPDHQLDQAADGFLAGYRKQCGWDESAYRCFLAIGILKSIPHTFRTAAADWPLLFSRLLQLAEQAVLFSRPAVVPARTTAFQMSEDQPLTTGRVAAAFRHPDTRLQFPLTQLQFVDARQVRFKPAKRCLLECTFSERDEPVRCVTAPDDSRLLPVLGKIRFKGADRRTPLVQQQLYACGFHEQSSVRVARYLGIVPVLNMWLQEKIQANPVTACHRTPPKVHAHVARALAAFHRSGVQVDRIHTAEDELAILHDRLNSVMRQHSRWSQRIGRVLEQCHELANSITRSPHCLIHRDFYFDQVLFDRQQVCVLDWDLAAMGSAELDVGNYLAHLLEFSIRSPNDAEVCRLAAENFQDAYMDTNRDARPAAVATWTTLSLARHIWISTLFTNRVRTTIPLLELVEDRLSKSFPQYGRAMP